MELTDEFELEHYRYLIARIAATNDNTIKIISAFSAAATLIVSGLVTLGLTYKQLGLGAEQALVYAEVLLVLLGTSCVFAILVMVINGIAWFEYRVEETRLLRAHGFKRQPPTLRSIPKWIETYLALILVVGTLTILVIATSLLLPNIK